MDHKYVFVIKVTMKTKTLRKIDQKHKNVSNTRYICLKHTHTVIKSISTSSLRSESINFTLFFNNITKKFIFF